MRICTIISVHTWTAIFLEHLANTSFMASFQAWTESLSGFSLWACILLPRPTRYLAVYYSGSGFTPNAFLLSEWLLTNVQVTTWHMCTHVYKSHQHYYSSLLSTHLPFFLAGWLIPTLPVGYNNTLSYNNITYLVIKHRKIQVWQDEIFWLEKTLSDLYFPSCLGTRIVPEGTETGKLANPRFSLQPQRPNKALKSRKQ